MHGSHPLDEVVVEEHVGRLGGMAFSEAHKASPRNESVPKKVQAIRDEADGVIQDSSMLVNHAIRAYVKLNGRLCKIQGQTFACQLIRLEVVRKRQVAKSNGPSDVEVNVGNADFATCATMSVRSILRVACSAEVDSKETAILACMVEYTVPVGGRGAMDVCDRLALVNGLDLHEKERSLGDSDGARKHESSQELQLMFGKAHQAKAKRGFGVDVKRAVRLGLELHHARTRDTPFGISAVSSGKVCYTPDTLAGSATMRHP